MALWLVYTSAFWFAYLCSAEELSSIYQSNTTLSLGSSPYEVTSDVVIESDVTITAENGVEIIFQGSYTITVEGTFDFCGIDTTNYNQRGLYDNTTHGYIHTNSTYPRWSKIAFKRSSNAYGRFCNVLFEHLLYAINTEWGGSIAPVVEVDNCEFKDLKQAIQGSTSSSAHSVYLYDSYFHDIDIVSKHGKVTIANCLFDDFSTAAIQYAKDYVIRHSTFRGYGTISEVCIHGFEDSMLEFNQIENCWIALQKIDALGTVQYNTFRNNSFAVDLLRDPSKIGYNNFIQNDVNIRTASGVNQEQCNYNYFGSNDESIIQSKNKDICSGYFDGLITFWPYFVSAIDMNDLNNLPTAVNISTFTCPGPDHGYNVSGGTPFSVLYLDDAHLSVTQSPYYVVGDVWISAGVTISADNGVEIIYLSDSTITVRGTFNFCDFNITNNTNHGLHDTTTYGYIHSDPSLFRDGMITFDTGYGHFCNVLFSGLDRAITVGIDGPTPYSVEVDHCEFIDVNIAFWGPPNVNVNGDFVLFSYTYFHDLHRVTMFASPTLEHCLIERFGLFDEAKNLILRHNTIIGDVNGLVCINTLIDGLVEYNEFINCSVAIRNELHSSIIRYNMFLNNSVAIDFASNDYSSTEDTVQYNNFIGNGINFRSAAGSDQPNCNYNYLGINSTELTSFLSVIIDACDGYSSSLIVWWPYYLSAIDFNDLSNPPISHTFTSVHCPPYNNPHNITGNTLNILYVDTYSLTLSESPYYVVDDVWLRAGSTVDVENGVEIIFLSDYTITVSGHFNLCRVNTSNNTQRGLHNATAYTHIHSESLLIRNGTITFIGNVNTQLNVCNVLFENMDSAISVEYDQSVYYKTTLVQVDNCEFKNLNYAFNGYTKNGNGYTIAYSAYFSDSSFHDIDIAANYGRPTFENCLFENFRTSVRAGTDREQDLIIKHCEIIGDGSQVCIDNFNNGIFEYNQITNCDVAIHLLATVSVIHFNNFMQNSINIRNAVSTDQTECGFNYFGTNTTNQSVIASAIEDECDISSLGTVTFWPWYIDPLDTNKNGTNSTMYSFDFTDCSSIDTEVSYEYVITTDPTKLPSGAPTQNSGTPTDNPTTSTPTRSPITVAPTDNPITVAPTESPVSPTGSPVTATPTRNPITIAPTGSPLTVSPTGNPFTLYPTESPALTHQPSSIPTDGPTDGPTYEPTDDPTYELTDGPTYEATVTTDYTNTLLTTESLVDETAVVNSTLGATIDIADKGYVATRDLKCIFVFVNFVAFYFQNQ
eukprot:63008_1